MVFKTASVDSIILYLGDKIDENLLLDISFFYKSLKSLNNPDIISIIPSYTSIFIRYNIKKYSEKSFKKYIQDLFETFSHKKDYALQAKTINIPVYYDLSVGLDLKRLSKEKNISVDQIITLHSEKTYLVYAVGFIPGFAYLGKVNKKLATPRIPHPRDFVPKGSVGIADNQTAVYPKKSPGGWNIIGKTPLNLFDPDKGVLSLFEIGDKVKFNPISKDKFLSMRGEINGSF